MEYTYSPIIDLTPIMQLAIMLLSAIITAFVVPWIKSKANAQQWEALVNITRTAVFAAEQVYGSGWGRDKLRYAEDYIKSKGYTVDVDLIEATVRQHFGHWDNPISDEKPEEEEAEDEEPQTPLV